MLLPAINPKAVKRTDTFIIAKKEGDNWRAIESHFTKFLCEKAIQIFKDHDGKYGRETEYTIFEGMAPTQNRTWFL